MSTLRVISRRQDMKSVSSRSRAPLEIAGVRKLEYQPAAPSGEGHAYTCELDNGVANGLAVARLCEWLARDGFSPDIVVGHNGWGEILYIKDVWPQIPLLGYFEFFYRAAGSDVDFDPEFPAESDAPVRLRTRNALNLLGLDAVDWGQSPTDWQRSQYPKRHRDRITLVHEGVDTKLVTPDPTARLWLSSGRCLSAADEVVTYSARDLEPYRGFHVFMRALPRVLEKRPTAQVLIVGNDGVSYGRRPDGAVSWRAKMLSELNGGLDLRRVHFLGHLPYRQYLSVLQVSTVHVYLTYPFVLSWSLIEAMPPAVCARPAAALYTSARAGPERSRRRSSRGTKWLGKIRQHRQTPRPAEEKTPWATLSTRPRGWIAPPPTASGCQRACPDELPATRQTTARSAGVALVSEYRPYWIDFSQDRVARHLLWVKCLLLRG